MTPLMKSCFWKVRGHNETTPLDEEFLLKGNDLLKSLRYSYSEEVGLGFRELGVL